jgi:MraZ protein
VPARCRERLGPLFVLTAPPFASCLILYPAVTWRTIGERLDEAPVKDDDYWEFVREWNRFTDDEATCDAQGRLLVPSSLRSKAGIEREVVTIGVDTRVEIWNPARLEATRPTPETAKRIAAGLRLL